MPDYDGFSLLEHFENHKFFVVFVSSHAKYAIKALKAEAFDYLLKPLAMDDLKAVLERLTSKISEDSILKRIDNGIEALKGYKEGKRAEAKRIALPTFEGLEFYQIDEIIRCEADRAYCFFHLLDGTKLLVSRPLRDFEQILEQQRFIRIHKSHMINLNYIQKYVKGRGGYVIMTDGCKLQVSVRRRNDLLDQFMSI
jgi:two-component system LytT family response regulator